MLPEAVKVTLPPLQNAVVPEAETVGVAGMLKPTAITLLDAEVQPPAETACTE